MKMLDHCMFKGAGLKFDRPELFSVLSLLFTREELLHEIKTAKDAILHYYLGGMDFRDIGSTQNVCLLRVVFLHA